MYIHDDIELKQKPLGIPYLRDNDPQRSHSYVNLREHPELISVLPELQDAPPLREFISALNAPDSPYETFGCEKWTNEYSHEQLPEFTNRKGCYVDLAFADKFKCQSPDAYRPILESLRKYEEANRTYDVLILHCELQPTIDNRAGVRWWTLSLWMYGVGRNEAEAEHWWAECLKRMQTFLLSPGGALKCIPRKESDDATMGTNYSLTVQALQSGEHHVNAYPTDNTDKIEKKYASRQEFMDAFSPFMDEAEKERLNTELERSRHGIEVFRSLRLVDAALLTKLGFK